MKVCGKVEGPVSYNICKFHRNRFMGSKVIQEIRLEIEILPDSPYLEPCVTLDEIVPANEI